MKSTIKLITLLSLLTLLISCGGEKGAGPTTFFSVSSAAYVPFINQKDMPRDVDLTKDTSFLNSDYPIEIALYKNGVFFYDLPNLGTGTGTYLFEEGKINLFAKRKLFNMNIEIISSNAAGTEFVLRFRDRFGIQVIPTETLVRAPF